MESEQVVTGARYFLQRKEPGPWKEVTKEEWVKEERRAGFYSTMGRPDEPATGGFGGANGVDGRIVDMKYATPEGYDFDPKFRDAVWPLENGQSTNNVLTVAVPLMDLKLLLQKAEPLLYKDWDASNAIDRLGDLVCSAEMKEELSR